MPRLPRLAIGSVDRCSDYQPMLWALLDVLQRSDLHVQTFLSQACFAKLQGAHCITGECHRHLDSWLMSPEQCRAIFRHGGRQCDISIVEGCFASPSTGNIGGTLANVCNWLDLPRIGVLNVARIANCQMSVDRPQIDALLLDEVADSASLSRWQTQLEALWGIPILGALDALPVVRTVIGRLSRGSRPSRDICRALGDSLLQHLDVSRLMRLSDQRDFAIEDFPFLVDRVDRQELRVAVAYDDAFHSCFLDTLDLLEIQGATITDFSPLRDESIPRNTDLVYFGCGRPESYAEALSHNHCMHTGLREHIRNGGRLYAEGGGLAYLCRSMQLPDSQPLPMVGALPVRARLTPSSVPPFPVELALAQSNWFGDANSTIRGYLNTRWSMEREGDLINYVVQPDFRFDLLGQRSAVGSRIHLNFAAQPNFLQRFFVHAPDSAKLSTAR